MLEDLRRRLLRALYPWNPARHRRAIAVVVLSELPVQRWFLVKEYEDVDY